ncbi:MAG: hypothetical protein WA102_08095 [Candidatus Methanoperedens sp.]
MNLKYNLLWFEDSETYVESLKPRIEEYLENLGFTPIIDVKPNGNDLEEMTEDDELDLILMDFNLNIGNAGDENGNILINKIRDHKLYTEIIFYSALPEFEDAIERRLEGVFFSERRDLFEKAKKIIDLTVKKNQDINNMRGLVIAETIDLEAKMDNLILTYFGSDDEKKVVCGKILDPDFDALSITNKMDLINKILKERIKSIETKQAELQGEQKEELRKKKQSLEKLKSNFVKLKEEVIDKRNILAHTREDEDHKNTLISQINKKGEKIVVDDEWCKDIRKNIKTQSQILDEITQHI